jgi:hypothetical protein
MRKPAIIVVCLFTAAVLCLSGCASLTKSFAARKLRTEPEISAVILAEPYTIKAPSVFGRELLTLPAGRYTAQQEDDEGVYYFAPSRTTARGLIPITTRGRGGIYLTRSTPPMALYFRVSEGSPLPYIDAPDEPLDTSRMLLEKRPRRSR